MNEDSTGESELRQLARLMRSSEDEELPRDEIDQELLTAELLGERLAGTLPLGSIAAALPLILQGRGLGEVLLDPTTDLIVMREIKDYARRLADREVHRLNHGPEYAVAVCVHYAAVAAALAFHDKKITSFSFKKLAAALEELAGKPWMTAELRDLLRRAATISSKKAQ